MNKVVSRRGGGGGSVQQTIVTKDVGHHPKRKSMSVSLPKNPVPFILPLFQDSVSSNNNDSSSSSNSNNNDHLKSHNYYYDDSNTKRKYRVHLPTRMLCILATVFLMVPLFIFGYRETHIHANESGPHFKVEKYVNVNTEDVLLELSQHNIENHHRPPAEDAADQKSSATGPSSSEDQSKGEKEGASPVFMDVLGELVKKVEEQVETFGGGGDLETDTKETNEGNTEAMDNRDSPADIPQEEEEDEEGDIDSPDIDSKDSRDAKEDAGAR